MVKSTIVSSTDTAGIEGTNEYGYDASQKRVNKKVTRSGSVVEDTVYIYAGPNCVAEYTKGTAATSPDQEYVYAQAIDSLVMIVRSGGTQKLAVTRNQQWSVSALADNANGTILERYTYDLFGKRTILAADGSTVRTTSSYDNPYGYTSRRHDEESGLMYFRARFYDCNTGEFASQDPLEYVDGMSLMRGYFVSGFVDPTGQDIQVGTDGNGVPIWDAGGYCYIRKPGCSPVDNKVSCPKDVPCGGSLDEATENVYDLCMLICDQIPIDNPVSACNACKKLGPPESPARKLCEWACEQAPDIVPDIKGGVCEVICCSGKLPNGIPWQECLSVFFEDNDLNNKDKVKESGLCCDRKGFPTGCTTMCSNQGGGLG